MLFPFVAAASGRHNHNNANISHGPLLSLPLPPHGREAAAGRIKCRPSSGK
jgi:hypothetical protein